MLFPQGKKNTLAWKLADRVRNLTKEEINKMGPEERKKPYLCESRSLFILAVLKVLEGLLSVSNTRFTCFIFLFYYGYVFIIIFSLP